MGACIYFGSLKYTYFYEWETIGVTWKYGEHCFDSECLIYLVLIPTNTIILTQPGRIISGISSRLGFRPGFGQALITTDMLVPSNPLLWGQQKNLSTSRLKVSFFSEWPSRICLHRHCHSHCALASPQALMQVPPLWSCEEIYSFWKNPNDIHNSIKQC